VRQSTLYATGLDGDQLTQGRQVFDLLPGQTDRLRTAILSQAVSFGLSTERMTDRLATGAANAWEERDRVRSDLLAISGRRRADIRNPEQSRRVVDDLQCFYDGAARLIDHARAHDVVPEKDRLLRALGSMARIMQSEGKVEFRSDPQAEYFADELRQHYGKGIVAELAAGRTELLPDLWTDFRVI
jgi:type IV secretion system T-DNA border endonuclease VirD2